MAAVSSVITIGLLGTPSLVVTLGLSPGIEVVVTGTGLLRIGQITQHGVAKGQITQHGVAKGQIVTHGIAEGEIRG